MAHYTFSTRESFPCNKEIDVEAIPKTFGSVAEIIEPLVISCVRAYHQNSDGKEIELEVERSNDYVCAGNSQGFSNFTERHVFVNWNVSPKNTPKNKGSHGLPRWTISLSCWIFYKLNPQDPTCRLSTSINYTADPTWVTEQSRRIEVGRRPVSLEKNLTVAEVIAVFSSNEDYCKLLVEKFFEHLCEIDEYSKKLQKKYSEAQVEGVELLVQPELIQRVQENPELLQTVLKKLCGDQLKSEFEACDKLWEEQGLK
jgi:hypothetical protein